MAEQKSGGTFLLKKSDFVAVVDAEGNDLPSVPKHWTADDLPVGAKKKSGASARSASMTSGGGQTPPPADSNAEPAGNASTEAWVDYATRVKGAKPEDLVDEKGDQLNRDALRAKFGTPAA